MKLCRDKLTETQLYKTKLQPDKITDKQNYASEITQE